MHLFTTGTEVEEAGLVAQVSHEALFAAAVVSVAAAHLSRHHDTGLRHLSKGEGRHAA